MTTKTSKATLGDLRATPSFTTGDRVSFVSVHQPGGDTIDRVCNGARDKQADADRIVACVNALDGIDDPEAFVEAAKHITRELTDGILAHGLSSDQRELLFSLVWAAGGRR